MREASWIRVYDSACLDHVHAEVAKSWIQEMRSRTSTTCDASLGIRTVELHMSGTLLGTNGFACCGSVGRGGKPVPTCLSRSVGRSTSLGSDT